MQEVAVVKEVEEEEKESMEQEVIMTEEGEEKAARKRPTQGGGTPATKKKKKRRQEEGTQLLKALLSSPSMTVDKVEEKMIAELDSLTQVHSHILPGHSSHSLCGVREVSTDYRSRVSGVQTLSLTGLVHSIEYLLCQRWH